MPDMTHETDTSDGFQVFLRSLREKALAGQIRATVFDSAVAGLAPLPDVLERIENQAEHALSLAAYMEKVIPETRLRRARAALRANRPLLLELESRFHVEPQVVVAIWAVETDVGRQRGTTPTLAALATLGWKSRRAAFFQSELIAALRIIQTARLDVADLRGSWAGAMGHGQFMPTSFLEFAVDFDGDGRADIWGDDPADGLASIANYLSKHGWQRGLPWGLAVDLPAGFDFELSGPDQVRPTGFWRDLGVHLAADGAPADYGPASVLLPGGHRGPAFLALRNYHVLTRYNNSMAYALAVGVLSDRMVGTGPRQVAWPDEQPLTRLELHEMQTLLAGQGHRPGSIDGLMGPDTARALRAFQKDHGLPADGFPDAEMLRRLRAAQALRG